MVFFFFATMRKQKLKFYWRKKPALHIFPILKKNVGTSIETVFNELIFIHLHIICATSLHKNKQMALVFWSFWTTTFYMETHSVKKN